MALVRVRKDGFEFNVGAGYAASKGLEVIDSPTHTQDGRPRRATRLNDRPVKPKKSVAEKAAEKAAGDVLAALMTPSASVVEEEAASTADTTNNPPSSEEN